MNYFTDNIGKLFRVKRKAPPYISLYSDSVDEHNWSFGAVNTEPAVELESDTMILLAECSRVPNDVLESWITKGYMDASIRETAPLYELTVVYGDRRLFTDVISYPKLASIFELVKIEEDDR